MLSSSNSLKYSEKTWKATLLVHHWQCRALGFVGLVYCLNLLWTKAAERMLSYLDDFVQEGEDQRDACIFLRCCNHWCDMG